MISWLAAQLLHFCCVERFFLFFLIFMIFLAVNHSTDLNGIFTLIKVSICSKWTLITAGVSLSFICGSKEQAYFDCHEL